MLDSKVFFNMASEYLAELKTRLENFSHDFCQNLC